MPRIKTYFFFSFFVLLTTITSCNTSTSNDTISLENEPIKRDVRISPKDIEGLKYTEYVLSDLAEKTTADWVKFDELETQIESLKKADLSFFNDENELLTTFFTDLKNQIPKDLAIHAIQVRIAVLETASFKLEGINKLHKVENTTKLQYIKDVLVSYSNLILQINKKLERDSQKIEKP